MYSGSSSDLMFLKSSVERNVWELTLFLISMGKFLMLVIRPLLISRLVERNKILGNIIIKMTIISSIILGIMKE